MKIVFLVILIKKYFLFERTFYGKKSKRIKSSKEKLLSNRRAINNIAFLDNKSIAQNNWVRTHNLHNEVYIEEIKKWHKKEKVKWISSLTIDLLFKELFY